MGRIIASMVAVLIAGIGVWMCLSIAQAQVGRQESPVYHASRPGDGSAAVTPNDSTDFTRLGRSLYITTGGAVKFTALDGTVDTWTVPDSFYLNIQVTRVWATGTTALGIHIIY